VDTTLKLLISGANVKSLYLVFSVEEDINLMNSLAKVNEKLKIIFISPNGNFYMQNERPQPILEEDRTIKKLACEICKDNDY